MGLASRAVSSAWRFTRMTSARSTSFEMAALTPHRSYFATASRPSVPIADAYTH